MTKVDGIVLAGGRGSRVGGQDKGLLDWQGRSLIEQVIARIQPQVSSLYISANRNLDEYARLGYPVYRDTRGDYPGPLAGIEACASHCTERYCLIVSCDCPELPLDLCERLFANLSSQRLTASYAHDGERDHYLCALIEREALAGISDYLDEGKRSVKGWLDSLNCKPSDFSDRPTAFRNINRLP